MIPGLTRFLQILGPKVFRAVNTSRWLLLIRRWVFGNATTPAKSHMIRLNFKEGDAMSNWSGNNSGDYYVRDRIGTQMTEGLGVDYQHGRYVVVYYNGKYYGLHDLRERNSEYFYDTRYGLDPNDIDLLDASNEAGAGSSTDYKAMIDWLQSNELTNKVNYNKIAEQDDVGNYMNYMSAEMFVNNGDWPHNNLKKWRVASQKSKWKWFLYDVDFGFGACCFR